MRPALDSTKRFAHETGVRSFRYLHLLKILVQSQATRAYVLTDECFQYLDRAFPTSAHIEEHVSLLSVFLLITICFPIPKGIVNIEQQNLIEMTKHFVFYNDDRAIRFFTNMN